MCVHAGADEDVEAVMARLAAQSAENIALKERQAKLDKDRQVRAFTGQFFSFCAVTKNNLFEQQWQYLELVCFT